MPNAIRTGIVGANMAGGLGGSWGVAAHLPALSANPAFDVVAVATTQEATALATAEHFGIPKAYGDAQDMMRDPDIDLIAICTRVTTHKHLVEMALDAGKHVFCEWPLGVSLIEAEQLAARARHVGVKTMIGLQSRQSPAISKARAIIATGEIGEVQACQVMHSGPWAAVVPKANVAIQLAEGGGNFTTIRGGHTLDALCSLAGPIAEVSATGQTVCPDVRILETGEIFTRTCWDQMAIIGTSKSSAMVSLQLHGGPGAAAGIRIEVTGSKGSLLIEGSPLRGIQMAELTLATIAPDGSRTNVALDNTPFGGNPMIGNVARGYAELAAAVAEGRDPEPGFENAVVLHRLVDAVARSAAEGRLVSAL